METSSEAYATLDPNALDNFKNPLWLSGEDGAMGVLEVCSTATSSSTRPQ